MVVGFFSLLELLLCVRALVRSLRARFPVGVAGAGGAIAGPIVSFAVLFAAWLRTRDVPAAREEEAGRPFRAWLPLAILDALYVVIQLGALVIMRER